MRFKKNKKYISGILFKTPDEEFIYIFIRTRTVVWQAFLFSLHIFSVVHLYITVVNIQELSGDADD